MMSEPYTPTTDEIIRSFSIPPHRVIEREEGETFADYLTRLSIEGHGYQMESEAAAYRWLAEHDRQVAERAWDEGFDEASDDLGRAQMMSDMGEGLNPYRAAKGN